MGFFDLIGGTNNFKKGMVAGAKPFEDKFAQYSEALNRLEKDFGENWNKAKNVADKILESVEATERARIYGLHTQTDIKTLKPEYKKILIAILYTLSSDSSNEFQQSYIRSVQKYLDIKNPQISIEFSAIDQIDSRNVHKAIFQSCVEYLLLGNDDPALFQKYGDQLFSQFILKDDDMEAIWGNVLYIYTAIGPLGLAEKYGFVPEIKNEKKTPSREARTLEPFIIEDVLNIPSGQEMVIEDKEIVLKNNIRCGGRLVLKYCVLRYNGDNIGSQILLLEKNAVLVLSQCTIIGENESERSKNLEKYFITTGWSNPGRLDVDKCIFLNCVSFAEHVSSFFSDSIIRYTKIPSTPISMVGLITKEEAAKSNRACEEVTTFVINFIQTSACNLEGCLGVCRT